MAALTETSEVITEFGGNYKVASYLIDGATGTNRLTISEFDSIQSATATLAEAPTGDCQNVAVLATGTDNEIDVVLYNATNAVCSVGPLDFYLQVVGKG